MLNQLYQSANCPKEKLVIKGAGHAQCEKIGGQVYWSKIDSLLEISRLINKLVFLLS